MTRTGRQGAEPSATHRAPTVTLSTHVTGLLVRMTLVSSISSWRKLPQNGRVYENLFMDDMFIQKDVEMQVCGQGSNAHDGVLKWRDVCLLSCLTGTTDNGYDFCSMTIRAFTFRIHGCHKAIVTKSC